MTKQYFFTEKMCVGYGATPIIKDIGIALQAGEILTVIGSNGAGKSTVLKSIAGQLRTLGGRVFLGGEDLLKMHQEERARKMSVLLTEKLQAGLMTCRDVVATGRYPYTGRLGVLSGEDNRIVDEAMELVHVTDMEKADFCKISDGQKQRVMLARAICQEPEILILDEPVSYLDIKYKLEFLSLLLEMREKRGLTVIMSLHELDLARMVSDKVLCLKGEYVFRCGTPQQVFEPGMVEELFDIDVAKLSSNEMFRTYVQEISNLTC